MSKFYKKLPSSILKIEDEYTAFCIDEAIMLIHQMANARDEEGNLIHPDNIWSVEERKLKSQGMSSEELIARLEGRLRD